MDLDVIRGRVERILENHLKHGLIGAESLNLMKVGADIALVILKWELEKKGAKDDRLSR